MEGDQLKLLSPAQHVQSSYTHKVTASSQSYKLCTLLKATICWNTIMNIEYFHPSDIIKFRLKACSVLAQTVQRCWQLCGSWWEKSLNMRRGCNFPEFLFNEMLWNYPYVGLGVCAGCIEEDAVTAVRYLILWKVPHVTHMYRDIWSFPAMHDLDVFVPRHTWFKSVGDYQAWWRADHFNQVCLGREESKTHRAWSPQRPGLRNAAILDTTRALSAQLYQIIFDREWISCGAWIFLTSVLKTASLKKKNPQLLFNESRKIAEIVSKPSHGQTLGPAL